MQIADPISLGGTDTVQAIATAAAALAPVKTPARITQIVPLSAELFEYHVEPKTPLHWEPGAHMHIGLPGFDKDVATGGKPNKTLVHHMSIVTLEEDGDVVFVTRIPREGASVFKQALRSLTVGDTVTLFKVARVLELKPNTTTIFITQGVGLAPVVPLMRVWSESKLTATPDNSTVISIHISRDGEHIYANRLVELLGASSCYACENRGALKELVASVVDPNAAQEFVVVGSSAFLHSQIASLRELGVRDEMILLDKKPSKREKFFGIAQ